jgi:hypothetical protein
MTKIPVMSYDEEPGDEPVLIGHVDMSLTVKDGDVMLTGGEFEALGMEFSTPPRSAFDIPAFKASSKGAKDDGE